MRLQVMTYNIHHGVGTDRKYDLQRIGDVIKQSNADIIGLNEVDVHFSKRSNYDHQLKWLAEYIGYDYAFAPALQKQGSKQELSEYGNGLLSRYPIIHVQQQRIKSIFSEDRSILEAEIKYEDVKLKVFVTHLSLNPIMHRRQRRIILEKVAAKDQPVIVMGDWNMLTKGRAWREVNQVLQDINLAKNGEKLFTFSSSRPIIQLDYIFVNDYLQIMHSECYHQDTAASDHLPILSLLRLNE